jgi:hypothetical protein
LTLAQLLLAIVESFAHLLLAAIFPLLQTLLHDADLLVGRPAILHALGTLLLDTVELPVNLALDLVFAPV